MLTSKIITESVLYKTILNAVGTWTAAINLFQLDLVNHEIPCDEKLAPPPLLPIWKSRGSNGPALRASLRVTEKYTIVANILDAFAHL